MGLREVLIPQDQVFFDLFEEMAEILVKAADMLVQFTESGANPVGCCPQMKDLEHAGDTVTHRIYDQLNRTFITPLEPEEISRLASVLDDVLDCVEGSVQMMRVYGIEESDDVMRQMAKLIQLSVVELQGAIQGLRKLSNGKNIDARVIEINRLENLADDVLGARPLRPLQDERRRPDHQAQGRVRGASSGPRTRARRSRTSSRTS